MLESMPDLKSELKLAVTEEQRKFIDIAKSGKNVLVDACIGSGKTTAIQRFCWEISWFLRIDCECEKLGIHFHSKDYPTDDSEFHCPKKVLYLTYNKMLKNEARRKIKISNIDVHNYNSFTVSFIPQKTPVKNQIKKFLEIKPDPERIKYDILIIDEYQDIKEEHADLLNYIKTANPNIQIIAVGDRAQKIYDYTRLEASVFIKEFLGEYVPLEFTKCFRLNKEYAAKLGNIWEKKIVGVNKSCNVRTMTVDEVINFLLDKNPGDILCLGENSGKRIVILNKLEELRPNKFNKNTAFSRITDGENTREIEDGVAIFCTYDSCKGLERDICVITDFTNGNWNYRAKKPNARYEILRNIFLVAASRGKKEIIFVERSKKEELIDLDGKLLKTPFDEGEFEDLDVSHMYEFKFEEDIKSLYSCLDIKEIKQKDTTEIKVKNTDGYIDLSPCIGEYQEYMFFNGTNIDDTIEEITKRSAHKKIPLGKLRGDESLEEKVLYLTALDTEIVRYVKQVEMPYITQEAKNKISSRLSTIFSRDEEVQIKCEIPFYSKEGKKLFDANGFIDVFKDNIIYELKFVSGLSNENFLQCATYLYATGIEKGILWNTKMNEMYEIKIPDRNKFADLMARTVTKGRLTKYYNIEKSTSK